MKLAKLLLFGAATIGAGLGVLAGPASPNGIQIRQPDGSTIQARILGDEFQGWVETQDGYTIVKNTKTGVWEYGMLDGLSGQVQPSGHPVHPGAEAPSFLGVHLKPRRNEENEALQLKAIQQVRQARLSVSPDSFITGLPVEAATVSGTRKLLVIRVNFSDWGLITTASGWNSTIFQTGNGSKSVRQFYRDNSFNTLDIVPISHTQSGSPAGIVTVTIAASHPNNQNNWDYDVETTWLNLALAQAAPYVDYAALDTNGDGQITTDEAVFYFIPAGYDASGSPKTPSIWAHAWGGTPGLTAGSKTIQQWAMNGELNDADRQHPMGVIAHELGHSMAGLPDLYDTSYTNSGLGVFSLMSYGSWGGDSGEDLGTTPVSLDAWCRQDLGWTTPVIPTSNGQTVSLGTGLSNRYAAARLQNPTLSTQEYFLVENRYPSGWDRGLTGLFGSTWSGGLLVMHVDDLIASNQYVAGSYQRVMAEHADNAAYGTYGTATSLFYTGIHDSFTPTTLPSSAYYSGSASNIGLTSASTPGTTMTFNMDAVDNSTTLSVDPLAATLVSGATHSLVGTTGSGSITWTLPAGQGSLSAPSTASGTANIYTAPSNLMADLVATVTLTNSTKTATSNLTIKTLNVNGDSSVDLLDILALAQDWGTAATRSCLSGGSTVGDADLTLLLTGLGF